MIMDFSEFIRNNKFHLIAVVVFIIASYLYFFPVLEGKVLRANDSMVSKINTKEIQDYRAKFGEEPLWTNSVFSGMPAYLISTKYPGNLIKHVDNIIRIFKMPVSVLFLSMLGFYILLLFFKIDPLLAIVGSLAYGLSSFFFQIIAAGHNTQAIALAYLPPVIGSVYYAYRKNALKGALLTAFFLALEIQANHPQITYYGMLCLLIFGIVELLYAIKDKTIPRFVKTSVILIIPFIIAIGINFASLYTTWEYGKYSIRGKSELTSSDKKASSGLDKDYITFWSYGVDETFNMLIPNYKGGSSHPFDRTSETVKVLRQNNAADAVNQVNKYWGTQPGTEGPHYVGAIVMFLFVLGLFLVKGPEKWWLLFATALSVMLSWGKNFMFFSNIFIDYFPGYNKFRAVTMTLVIAEFCIPLLGLLALRNILNGTVTRNEIIKNIKIAAGITGGFTLLVMILPGIAGSFLAPYESGYPDWLKTALVSDRKGLLRTDAFRSLIFIILAAIVILGLLYEKLKKNHAILLLGALIVLDLWFIDKRYLNSDRFEQPSTVNKTFTPTTADNFILKDKSYYRVLNLAVSTFNDNSPTSYFHKSIGGYHGAKMKRYQELIDSSLSTNIELIRIISGKAKTIDEFQQVFEHTSVLNMLNAKYVIYHPDAPPVVNTNALGNVWFVEKPVLVENPNQEISALKNFNPSNEAFIDKRFEGKITKLSYPVLEGESIELTSYQPNELKYKYSTKEEKLAVFSEIYYPEGWEATIDGKPADHFRADYVLRSMVLPAGNHEIVFSFKPSSYTSGNRISFASSLLLILMIGGYISYSFLRKK